MGCTTSTEVDPRGTAHSTVDAPTTHVTSARKQSEGSTNDTAAPHTKHDSSSVTVNSERYAATGTSETASQSPHSRDIHASGQQDKENEKQRVKEKKRLLKLGYKKGFSPQQRPNAWKRLLDADKLQEKLPDLYEALLAYGPSIDDDTIRKDIGRTFPTLPQFASTGDRPLIGYYLPALYRILTAYANLDITVGYCQGMSFLAGLVLLAGFQEEKEAFYAFLSLMLNNQVLDLALKRMDGKLSKKLSQFNLSATVYATSWLMTGFARSSLPIPTILSVLDICICEKASLGKSFFIPKLVAEAMEQLGETVRVDFIRDNTQVWSPSEEALSEYRALTEVCPEDEDIKIPCTLLRAALVLVKQRKRRVISCATMDTVYGVVGDHGLSALQTNTSYAIYIEKMFEQPVDVTNTVNLPQESSNSEHDIYEKGSEECNNDEIPRNSSGEDSDSTLGDLETKGQEKLSSTHESTRCRPATAPSFGARRRTHVHPKHKRHTKAVDPWRRLTLPPARNGSQDSARTASSLMTSLCVSCSSSDDEYDDYRKLPNMKFNTDGGAFAVKPFSVRKLLKERSRRRSALGSKRNSQMWIKTIDRKISAGGTREAMPIEDNCEEHCDYQQPVEEAPTEEQNDQEPEVAQPSEESPEKKEKARREPLFSLLPEQFLPGPPSPFSKEVRPVKSQHEAVHHVKTVFGESSSTTVSVEIPDNVDALCGDIPCEHWMLPEDFVSLLKSRNFKLKKSDLGEAFKQMGLK